MLSQLISSESIKSVKLILRDAKQIVITSHMSPDGDAVGSSLGMKLFLSFLDIKADVVFPNASPEFLKWLPGADDVYVYDKQEAEVQELMNQADVIFALDYNAPNRIGALGELLVASEAKKIVLDHHPDPQDFCDVTISHPELSSTAELLFRFIVQMGFFPDLTAEMATCIYTGMMTDTGGFSYNSNSPEIYYIISQLLSKGIDKDSIYRRVNNTYSETRMRLQGLMLQTMKTYPSKHATLMILTQQQQQTFHMQKGDSEGFVNMPLAMKGMRMSCLMKEDEEGYVKISLRSIGNIPVNEMSNKYFNGGGHKNAAGGEFRGTLEECIIKFEEALVEYKPLLTSKNA